MTEQPRRPVLAALSSVALGLLGALFVAVSVFADGQAAERRWLILAILAGYACAGFLAGWLAASWRPGLWLSFPALVALLLFGEETALSLAYFALILACAVIGAGAGTWARVRRGTSRS